MSEDISGYLVASGQVPSLSHVHIFGRNASISTTNDPQDIWEGGNDYTGHPTGAPETVTVVSDNAADTAAGTGARQVTFFDLRTSDSTEETSETVSMNGLAGTTSLDTWYRIYRAKVDICGTGGQNAGIITIAHSTTTSNVFAGIPVGFGHSQICAWTCPDRCNAWLTNVRVRLTRASGAAGSALIAMRLREFGTNSWQTVNAYDITTNTDPNEVLTFPLHIPPKADIKMRVVSVSDNATAANADLAALITPV